MSASTVAGMRAGSAGGTGTSAEKGAGAAVGTGTAASTGLGAGAGEGLSPAAGPGSAPRNSAAALAPSLSPADQLAAALQRLQTSRAVLRQALIPPPEPANGRDSASAGAPLRQAWRQARRLLRGWPVADLASQALQRWWHSQPWQPAGQALLGGIAPQVAPLVRRHPLASVALAAAVGAGLVGLRPWRWRAVRAHCQPVPGHVGRWLLAQLTSAPMQAALASLVVMAMNRPDTATDDPAAPTAAAPPAAPPAAQPHADRTP